MYIAASRFVEASDNPTIYTERQSNSLRLCENEIKADRGRGGDGNDEDIISRQTSWSFSSRYLSDKKGAQAIGLCALSQGCVVLKLYTSAFVRCGGD